jgi:hypothetical protein
VGPGPQVVATMTTAASMTRRMTRRLFLDRAHEPATVDRLNLISDAFSRALVWATEAKSMVDMGWHLATMLKVMRPELLENDSGVPRDMETGLRAALGDVDPLEVGLVTNGCWPGVAGANHFRRWGSGRSR